MKTVQRNEHEAMQTVLNRDLKCTEYHRSGFKFNTPNTPRPRQLGVVAFAKTVATMAKMDRCLFFRLDPHAAGAKS